MSGQKIIDGLNEAIEYARGDASKAIVRRRQLTKHELRVLQMLAGECPGEWGAWVSEVLEDLESLGLCTQGPNCQITDRGLDALRASAPACST